MQHSGLINIMVAAAKKAGPRMLRDFHELRFLQNSLKSTKNFVKATIEKAEETILPALNKARLEFGLISAMQGIIQKPNPTFIAEHSLSPIHKYWVVNVLDGGENFTRAIPYFAISIAVKQINSAHDEEVIAGMIYAPALGELYFAEKGNGAWCEFSQEDKAGLSETRLRTSERLTTHPIILLDDITDQPNQSSIRLIGSASISLAYLAAGRADRMHPQQT